MRVEEIESKTIGFEYETRGTFDYHVKGVRAMWDPDLGGGRGGWRCPPGTANAGQWSNRAGTNCGGAARKLVELVGSIGRRSAGRNERRSAPATRRVTNPTPLPPERRLGGMTGPDGQVEPRSVVRGRRPTFDEVHGITPEARRKIDAEIAAISPRFREQSNALWVTEPKKLPPRKRREVTPGARVQRRVRAEEIPAEEPKPKLPPRPRRDVTPGARVRKPVRVEEPKPEPKKRLKPIRPNRPIRQVNEIPKPEKKLPPVKRRGEAGARVNLKDKIPERMANLKAEKRREVARVALSERNKLRDKWRRRTNLGVDLDLANPNHRRTMQRYIDGANEDDRQRLQNEANDLIALHDYGVVTGVDHLSIARRRKVHDPANLKKEDAELGIDPDEFNDLVPEQLNSEDLPLVRWNGTPKVSALAYPEFDVKRRNEIDDATIENHGKIVALRGDWNDVQAIQDAAGPLWEAAREHRGQKDAAAALLRDRDWVAQNQALVKDMQAQYVAARLMESSDLQAIEEFQDRARLLAANDRFNIYAGGVLDPERDLSERQNLFALAEGAAKEIQEGEFKGRAADDLAERRREVEETLKGMRDEIQQAIDAIEGPRDRAGILREGGPDIRAQHERVQRAIERADPDELESARTRLQRELDRLGPEVSGNVSPEERMRNIRRRHLAASINDVRRAQNIGNGDALPYYDHAPKERTIPLLSDGQGGRVITNPNIKSHKSAVEFVRNGGSLEEVPNEYWGKVLEETSSPAKNDKSTRFMAVDLGNKRGAIGDTRVYLTRDENGSAMDAGYVVKGASADDNAGEQAGWNLAREHGFPIEGAMWDGKIGRKRAVVLPHVANGLPEGEAKLGSRHHNYDADMFDGQEDRAFPSRFHSALHNYILDVPDRHRNNGMTVEVAGKVWALPIDQGWATKYPTDGNFLRYLNNDYGMDHRLDKEMQQKVISQQVAENIVGVYDGMVARAEKVVEGGVDRFLKRMSSPEGYPEEEAKLRRMFKTYEDRLEHLRQNRVGILGNMIPPQFFGVINGT